MTQQIDHPSGRCTYATVMSEAHLDKAARGMLGIPEVAEFVLSAGGEQKPCEVCGVSGVVVQDTQDLIPEEEGYHIHFVCVGCAKKGADPTWGRKEDLTVLFLDAVLHVIRLASQSENGKEMVKESLRGVIRISSGIEDDVPDEHPVLRLIADDFWAEFEDSSPKAALRLEKEVRSMTAKEQVAMLIHGGNKGTLAYAPGMK